MSSALAGVLRKVGVGSVREGWGCRVVTSQSHSDRLMQEVCTYMHSHWLNHFRFHAERSRLSKPINIQLIWILFFFFQDAAAMS